MTKKLTYEYVKSAFEERGYTLLSQKYVSGTDRLEFSCPRGHIFTTTWKSFRRTKHKAAECSRCLRTARRKQSIARKKEKKEEKDRERREYLESFGYTFLGRLPGGKIKVVCPEGHTNSIIFGNFKKGNRCFDCFGSAKHTYEYVRGVFEAEGYTLVSKRYKGSRSKLETVCPEGHTYYVSFDKFKRRSFRCSFCSVNAPRDLSFVREEFARAGYTLVSDVYETAAQKFEFMCDKQHTHSMTIHNLRKGQKCGKCFEEFEKGRSSRPEQELGSLFSAWFEVRQRDRSIINPYEVDFYFPEKNLAVEYCGLYWHSESVGKGRDYHYNKMRMCIDKGVRLITIFEDEYLERPSVVLSRIKNALGLPRERVYARKCEVRSIPHRQARNFFDQTHLQGSGIFRVAFGIFYRNLMVGALSAGLLSRRHVAGGDTIELKRLAFLPGYSVVGGASKLFKLFLSYCVENNYNEIRSYCDMRWGNPFSPVYEKLGFTLLAETKYTPHYFKGQKRYRNQSLRKTPEERKTGKTEWQLRQEQGYRRIWDCGHRTYIYNI